MEQDRSQGPSSGNYGVRRGGSWSDGASRVRASSRVWFPSGYRGSCDGFRVVRSGRAD